jgi:hypothetical protein
VRVKDLINRCTQTAKDHGFNLKQHDTQLLLIATEIQEALEQTTWSLNDGLNDYIREFIRLCREFEAYRKTVVNHMDNSILLPGKEENYFEELADIQIRLWSYIGGNDFTKAFLKALKNKMKVNGDRPYKHGKGF